MQDKEKNTAEYDIDNAPGMHKEAAIHIAQQEGPDASPCGYCNRGDCMECSYAYK